MYPQMYIPAIKNVASIHDDVNTAAGISPVQEVTSHPTTLFPSESTSVPTSAHVASPRTVPFAHQHMDPQIEYLSLRTCIPGFPFFLLTRALFSSANEKQGQPQGNTHHPEHFQHFHNTTPLHTPTPLNPLVSYIPHRGHDNPSSHYLTPVHSPADVSNTIPPSIPGHDPFTRQSLVPHTARDPSLLPARFEYAGSPQFVTTPGSTSDTQTSALRKGYGPHFGMYDQIPTHNGALQDTIFLLVPEQTALTRQIKPDAVHAPIPSPANSRIGFPAGIQGHNSLTRQWTLTHGTILSTESDHLFFPASSISDTGGAQVCLWACLQVPSRWLEQPHWASPH